MSVRKSVMGVRHKIWVTFGERTLFGDGKAELLEGIAKLGSLHQAAAAMGMSYRYAWGLLRELEKSAGFPFVEHGAGGPRSRLRVTEQGRRFLRAYRSFRGPLAKLIQRHFDRAFQSW